jgi:biopolymer transport protein ExbD
MINHSIVNVSSFHSVLGECSILAPENERRIRNIFADLLLTALIDAFSILVIFLLMSFSSTGDLIAMTKGQELPKAAQTAMLERNPVVKVDEGKLFLEDKEVGANELTTALLEVRKKFQDAHPNEEFPGALTLQADRRVKYEVLNNVVLASSQAGFSDIKFAVVVK